MPDIERWRATWKGLGVESPEADLYAVVSACYAESHRSYHTIQHLDECFAHLDEAGHLADKVHEVELALWFHDAVTKSGVKTMKSEVLRGREMPPSSKGWPARSPSESISLFWRRSTTPRRPRRTRRFWLMSTSRFWARRSSGSMSTNDRCVRSIRGCRGFCFGASDVRFCRPSWHGHTSTAPITSGAATRCLPGPTWLARSNDLGADIALEQAPLNAGR